MIRIESSSACSIQSGERLPRFVLDEFVRVVDQSAQGLLSADRAEFPESASGLASHLRTLVVQRRNQSVGGSLNPG
jgi:hypothetical protein